MGTVASQLTRIHDVEGSLTVTSIGGGAGAAANTDIFLQAAQSLGRRLSNVTISGFLLDDGTPGVDLSAADIHVGMWMWITHYASLTALRMRLASDSGTANYDEHTVPLTEIPTLGGWIRVWVDISRTPDFTGGTGLNEAAVRHHGVTVSIPTVGGNAANVIIDAIDYGTAGLSLTGTSGLWSDFTTADADTTNKYGVAEVRSGIIYCRARLTLGTASSLVFTDSGFVIVFPQQNLVGAAFMGVTCDLQHASTVITISSGVFQSPGAVKGDFVVTGTAGDLIVTACSFSGLRVATFTSGCVLSGASFQTCGLVTQDGADMSGCKFLEPSGAVGLLSNNPALIATCAFTSDGTGHAIEATTAGTYTFTGNTFTGYAGTDGSTGNEAFYNNSGGLITLNISGGTTPSVRNGSGASTVVNSTVTVTVTPLTTGSEVRAYLTGTSTEVAGTESSTGSSYGLALPSGTAVDIVVLCYSPPKVPVRIQNVSFTVDQNLNPNQFTDRNFNNP